MLRTLKILTAGVISSASSALLLCTALLFPVGAAAAEPPSIVLIIDDLGYSRYAGLRAARLASDVTCAVLPHTPYAAEVAEQAHRLNKEVIVHVPMSSIHGRNSGPGGLNERQTMNTFTNTLQSNLSSVPHARGVNNHMGSSLTQNEEMMNLMMSVIAEHELYFIDSRTSPKTVAATMAGMHDIKHLSRDVFLDNSQDINDIHRQFQRLLQVARKTGLAVGIGHPYDSTLLYLEQVLPTLEAKQNVRIVRGSSAIAARYRSSAARVALSAESSAE